MFNITGKYVTVFNPSVNTEISDRMVLATLSTSKKNVRNGEVTYENMSWNGRFVGVAFEQAKELKDRDKIDIIKGSIVNRYDKIEKRLYVDVIVFDFIMSDLSKKGV